MYARVNRTLLLLPHLQDSYARLPRKRKSPPMIQLGSFDAERCTTAPVCHSKVSIRKSGKCQFGGRILTVVLEDDDEALAGSRKSSVTVPRIGPLLALSPLGSPVSLDSFAFENEDVRPGPTCRVEKAWEESLLGAYRITRHPREDSFPRERATM